ncbi:MAG TPA: type IV pilus assembly protein PilM [Patescibacteria group bacterium]|nr:type IV pilus assembly protein PilM [Patescibacteria group bacterium]
MGLFSSSSNNYLGIDLGSSSVKLVELGKKSKEMQLVNYVFSEKKGVDVSQQLNDKEAEYLVTLIDKMCQEGEVDGKNAVATLPTSSVFSSVINLSDVSKDELESAVNWEAKKVIPTSLEDMVLDWKIIEEDKEKNNIKIFLTASPKKLIKKYIDIFKQSKLNLSSLETEVFSLIRSLAIREDSNTMIVEIGTINTDISIVKGKIPVLNRSIDTGGYSITKTIANSLNVSLKRAEQFKRDLGVTSVQSNSEEVIPKTIMRTVNPIVDEVKYMLNLFENKNVDKVETIVLTGGSAFLPNLTQYLSQTLDRNVVVGDPWYNISYSQDMKQVLSEVGPKLAVAIGAAMREIE